jgi:hypothetical protein
LICSVSPQPSNTERSSATSSGQARDRLMKASTSGFPTTSDMVRTVVASVLVFVAGQPLVRGRVRE